LPNRKSRRERIGRVAWRRCFSKVSWTFPGGKVERKKKIDSFTQTAQTLLGHEKKKKTGGWNSVVNA